MSDRILVWLSACVLTAGVSAATVAGAGVATAQDRAGAGADGHTTSQSSDSPDAKADSDDTKKSDPSTKPDDDADSVDQDDSTEQPTGDDEGDVGTPPVDTEVDGDVNDNVATGTKDADRRRAHDRSPATEKTQDQRAVASVPAETVEKRDESETAQAAKRGVEENVEETNEPPADQHAAPDQGTVTVTPVVETQAPAPTTPPSDRGVVETVVTAVSSALSLLNPLASNTTPDVPAAEPQFWTLAAASRREFETAFVSPSLVEDPVDELTTSEADIAAVESTLTYTPPPTFRDQITLAFYEVFRLVSKVTGIPVYATLGALLASADPPYFLTWGLDAQRTVWTAEDGTEWKVWEFAPPEPTQKTVIAFHGGGWIFEANILNWIDYTSMARQTGATVVVPLYPLATTPDGAATEIIPEAADFIAQQMALRGGADNVSLYADSAGSLIAISAVRQLIRDGKPVPASMVLLSLVADSSLENPDIRDVDDPIFDLDTAQDVFASHWYDGITDRQDPSVSPLFFEPEILAALPPTTIYVGEREILYPDTLLLQQRAVEEGAPISVVVGTGLVHDWPSSGLSLIYSQTGAVRPDIYRHLGLTGDTTGLQALTVAAAQPAAAPSLINVIGTIAWSVLDAVIKAVDVPPVMPADSSVTFGRSTLEIDCGDGYIADADWYFPKSGEPEKFIYFQHGFPARAFVYDVTLRELAERNNAIVVAPSITSNYFACDGCSLTADPMHEAVAHLFEGDRAALLASARAAGFEGTMPRKFVIAGQSAGAMLAAGASGYYYDDPSTSAEEKADMVGVLLYDGSAANGALARALDKLPLSVPVLHIAGAPVLINNFGDANKVFLEERPGQFNGVQLVGGAHSDAFQSSAFFGLVQVFVGLTFGASTPENVEAVQVLSQGWLTDMYADRVYNEQTRTGIYGDPGEPGQSAIDIPTDAGLAQGYVLPGPTPAPSSIEQFIAGIIQSINANDYVTCATDPSSTSAAKSCSAALQTDN